MDYKACWEYQQRLFDTLLRAKGTPAEGAGYLLLVEHPAVYTLGKSGHAENLLVGEEYLRSIGAEFYHIDRGGDITFHVSNPNGLDKKVAVRIPQWSKDYTLEVNGEAVELPVVDGFVTVDASAADTEIHLVLDMSVRRVRASLRVRADIGKLAVARGPIVFCMEQVDNEGPLWLDGMSADANVSESYEPDLLDGVEVLKVKGSRLESPTDDQYRAVDAPLTEREETLTMIPYYAWCNRAEGQMQVWVRETK